MYPLVLLMAEGLVHAFIHVHNFILPYRGKLSLPSMSAPVSNLASKKKNSGLLGYLGFSKSQKSREVFNSKPALKELHQKACW
jgi:hypothetical protein